MNSWTPSMLAPAVLTVLMMGAVYTDLSHGKIHNRLTLTCTALGLILALSSGVGALIASLAGAGLVVLLYLLFAPRMGIGGGDVKLMMAVGALMGIRFMVWSLLLTAAVGGLISVGVMAYHRVLTVTLKNMITNLFLRICLRAPVGSTDGSRGLKFRYSPAIALGTLLAFVLRP